MTDPTTPRTDLAGLIERVRKATAPDRELDRALTKIDPLFGGAFDERNRPPIAGWWLYSSSVDAALALVERVLPFSHITVHGPEGDANTWYCELATEKYVAEVKAPTAPLAILLALLTALEQG